MKNQFKFILCIITVVICTMSNSLFAQFNWAPTPANDRWGQTLNPNLTINDIKAIGVGNFLDFGSQPDAALHVNTNFLTPTSGIGLFFTRGEVFRTTGSSAFLNAWRLWTGGQVGGPAATEKGMIFNYGNNPVVADQTNFSLQASVRDMSFYTLPITTNTVGTERMRILGVTRNLYPANAVTTYPLSAGNIGIGTVNPLAMVQIGLTAFSGSGYRDWMNRGVLIYGSPLLLAPTIGTDNMYIGIREITQYRTDAIISWGNNPVGTTQADRLRFIFTAGTAAGLNASGADGLEIARMISDGNTGRMGIGDFFNLGVDPVRTLDVFDAVAPQLRLTRSVGIHNNRFTDFETTPLGHLRINPSDTGLAPFNGRVGINLAVGLEPANTLEITSGPTSPYFNTNNSSGLRFTNLTSASPTTTPVTTNILSVDADGDVILVPGGTGIGTCASPTTLTTANGAIDMDDVANFYFIGNGAGAAVNNVIIGNNCAYTPLAKLDVLQASGTISVAGTIGLNVVNTDPKSLGVHIMAPNSTSALFIPEGGGKFVIGYPDNPAGWSVPGPASCLVQINGNAWLWDVWGNFFVASDSILKTNINEYTYGLDVVRKVKPITYNYNGKAMLPIDKPHIGVKAEDIAGIPEIAPFAVDTIQLLLNTSDTATTDVLTISNDAIFYTAINAIKELDSIITGITSPPAIPILLSPANEATGVSVSSEFNWKKQNNVNYYRIIFSTTPDSNGIYLTYDCNDTMAKPSGLCCSTTYYWWIIAYNSYGNSEPSEIWSFTTTVPPLPPVLASPANGDTIRDNFVTLSWFPSEGASAYNVTGTGVTIEPRPVYFIIDEMVVDTFFTIEITTDITYTWILSAFTDDQCRSERSEQWSFTALPGFKILNAQSVNELSDAGLKTNIAPLSGSLEKLQLLNGIYFNWDTLEYPQINFEQGRQIGLIAQDVQPIIPEVVKTDAQGFSYIDYNRLVPVLVEAIKEQQQTITAQQNEIDSLKSFVYGTNQKATGDNGNNGNQSNIQYVELVTENAIILNQNDPNPFAEETDITYHLTDDVSQAKILFYDNSGKIIKTVELIGRGDGSLHVYASNLSAGIYAYALVADGKVIDTKKMVCTKK